MRASRRLDRGAWRLGFALAMSALGVVLTDRASAQEDTAPSAGVLAADYRLTNADGDRVCLIALSDTPLTRGRAAPERFSLGLDRAACASAILFSVDIASWAPGPGHSIRLFGPDGALVAEFTEGVGGTWEALREGDGVYFLVNPRLADPGLHAGDLVGAWEIAEVAGTPLCRLELTDIDGGGGTFRARLKAGCPARLVALAPDRWRLDSGSLVLLTARGEGVRFAAQEDGGWEKVPPEEGTPLLLSRP
ncbi:AprI/Inh family metalloprotease inhibitor [Ancylobacter sp. FA202]|uniref:AprI/Inh family metalloprotease inhibitor n=1 Tax=Ancylobacter sp. FA202 TaxID=1111106 RepID=UPI000370E3DD|nr:AprI/Inh family metalloprotease inhibitor [Ancylobacter sp. FA202]